jgi:hypothetical protein
MALLPTVKPLVGTFIYTKGYTRGMSNKRQEQPIKYLFYEERYDGTQYVVEEYKNEMWVHLVYRDTKQISYGSVIESRNDFNAWLRREQPRLIKEVEA